jgi:hypothetical protein
MDARWGDPPAVAPVNTRLGRLPVSRRAWLQALGVRIGLVGPTIAAIFIGFLAATHAMSSGAMSLGDVARVLRPSPGVVYVAREALAMRITPESSVPAAHDAESIGFAAGGEDLSLVASFPVAEAEGTTSGSGPLPSDESGDVPPADDLVDDDVVSGEGWPSTGTTRPPARYRGASLHTRPATSAPLVTMVPAGATVVLLGESTVGSGYRWMRVRTAQGHEGWMIARAIHPG